MNNNTEYQNWPERVKITTALSSDKFIMSNYKFHLYVGYFVMTIGCIDAIDWFSSSKTEEFISPLAFIFLGIVNLFSAFSLKWISENSSWDERFKNNSSLSNRLISVFIILLVFACLYGIIKY